MATVPLATYILKRIHQLGVSHIQGLIFCCSLLTLLGVPGDMNLYFLDYIEEMPEITWGLSPLDPVVNQVL
jgi:TPP-dependent 2-oxoacid decarboxylase